jgi:hypothetical protein
LGGGDAVHRVEVLKQSEVRLPKVVEVFPGGDERLLDGLPGSAGRVLGLDVCHLNAFGAELLAGHRNAVSMAGACSVRLGPSAGPWAGPTPGVQSCGRMALLAEVGGHELAREHDKGALVGAWPGRACCTVLSLR